MASPELSLTGGQAIGDAAQGIGEIVAGVQRGKAGSLAREQSKINAALLDELAILKADEIRRDRSRVVGRRTAAFAAGGVNPNVGSALDVALDAAAEDELEALNAKFGFESQAFEELVRGRNAELQGQLEQTTGIIRGLNTLIQGGIKARGTQSLFPKKAAFRPSEPAPLTESLGGPFGPSNTRRIA